MALKTYYVVGFLFSLDCTCKKNCARVALIRKNRPSWQSGLWNGIGGKIEPNETSLEAMRREFREEAGLDIADWKLFLVSDGPKEVIHFYVAQVDQKTLRTVQTTTDEEVGVFHIDTACDTGTREFKAVPNLKWELHMAFAWLQNPCGVLRLSFPPT